jgi:hypothetical protein
MIRELYRKINKSFTVHAKGNSFKVTSKYLGINGSYSVIFNMNRIEFRRLIEELQRIERESM